MKKAIRRQVVAQEVLAQLRAPLVELMRSTLLDTVITAGSLRAIEMLEEQREALCGPRHSQSEQRQAYRHGTSPANGRDATLRKYGGTRRK